MLLLCPDCLYPMRYIGGEKWKCYVCIYVKAQPTVKHGKFLHEWAEQPESKGKETFPDEPLRDEDEDNEVWD